MDQRLSPRQDMASARLSFLGTAGDGNELFRYGIVNISEKGAQLVLPPDQPQTCELGEGDTVLLHLPFFCGEQPVSAAQILWSRPGGLTGRETGSRLVGARFVEATASQEAVAKAVKSILGELPLDAASSLDVAFDAPRCFALLLRAQESKARLHGLVRTLMLELPVRPEGVTLDEVREGLGVLSDHAERTLESLTAVSRTFDELARARAEGGDIADLLDAEKLRREMAVRMGPAQFRLLVALRLDLRAVRACEDALLVLANGICLLCGAGSGQG